MGARGGDEGLGEGELVVVERGAVALSEQGVNAPEQCLRALEPESVPSIALTAYTRADDRAKALSSGFTMHLGKPVDPRDLVAAVCSIAKPSSRADER